MDLIKGGVIGLAVVYFYYTYQQTQMRKVKKTNYENYHNEVEQHIDDKIKKQGNHYTWHGWKID